MLARIIEDLSKVYDQDFAALPAGRYVDEITFLELSKDITPLLIKPRLNDTHHVTSKVINFDDSDDEMQEESTSRGKD